MLAVARAAAAVRPLLLHMTVDIGDGRTGDVRAYDGDTPEALAAAFCALHGLDDSMQLKLTVYIETHLGEARRRREASARDARLSQVQAQGSSERPSQTFTTPQVTTEPESVSDWISGTPMRKPPQTSTRSQPSSDSDGSPEVSWPPSLTHTTQPTALLSDGHELSPLPASRSPGLVEYARLEAAGHTPPLSTEEGRLQARARAAIARARAERERNQSRSADDDARDDEHGDIAFVMEAATMYASRGTPMTSGEE